MLGSAVKVRNRVARRSLTVLGAGVALTAVLLSSGTAAFAKSDMSLKADHRTVKVGKSVLKYEASSRQAKVIDRTPVFDAEVRVS